MLVLKNRPEDIATKMDDNILIKRAAKLSFLCILISDQKNINDETAVIGRDIHIDTPNLMITLSII